MVEKTRIDKWLWAVRIYKSRSIAIDACKSGKVFIDGLAVKPSHWVQANKEIEVRKNGFHFSFKITRIIEKRVSAILASECYINQTSEEELNKFKEWFSTSQSEFRQRGSGRPTKKERREIDDQKESLFDWDDTGD
jgi:ribosome-associated heat shock protein Hsp15